MKEGWRYKKLGEVCDIFNGNSINSDYKKEHFWGVKDGLPFIATKDVLANGKVDYDNGVRIPNFKDFKIAPAKSVFICAEGGSAGKKFAYIEKDVCFGNKLFCVNPKVKNLEGKFVYHYIQSELFKKQFKSLITGLIGGVSAKKFQSIEILLPPYEEQQRIVSRLDAAFAHIDELKANAEKQLSEARALFQKSLAKAMKPKEGWKKEKLNDIVDDKCPISYGIVQQGDHIDGGIPVVRPVDLNKKYVSFDYLKCTTPQISSSYKRTILRGDEILLSVRGTTGIVSIAKPELKGCNVNRGIVPLFFKDNICKDFIYYEMISPFMQSVFAEKTTGSTLKQINIKDLRLIVFSYPPISEQQRIVKRLDSLSSHIRKLEENQRKIISECDALKQALLRKVFE